MQLAMTAVQLCMLAIHGCLLVPDALQGSSQVLVRATVASTVT